MSLSADAAATKRAALEQLRFNKSKKPRVSPSIVGALPSSSVEDTPAFSPPPAQSRDATVPSRFFTSTSTSLGNVLVPSSSPLSADTNYRSNHPHYSSNGYDVAPIPSLIQHHHPRQLPSSFGVDSLSAPTGFVTNNGLQAAPRIWTHDARYAEDMGDEGRPRKRINLGPQLGQQDVLDSPGSPEVHRPGQRRRPIANGIDAISTSSDESMPDVRDMFAGPSRPRIMRGRRPASPRPSGADLPPSDAEDPSFIRFKLTMPTHSPSNVLAAWKRAHGDVNKATALLSNPTWDPRPPHTQQLPAETTGRVEEIDEATKAQRAAAKEKGKKSMIYANRPILETKLSTPATPPLAKIDVDLTASSPIVQPQRRQRIKKLALDSESEVELTDGSDSKPQRSTSDTSPNENRVLDYFNTTNSAALQELTGCSPEQATFIIGERPFISVEDLNTKLGQGKKKAGPGGISPRMFEDCILIFAGYGTVDSILEDCERIGANLRAAIASWTLPDNAGKGKAKADSPAFSNTVSDEVEDGALSLRSLGPLKEQKPKDYLVTQPSLLPSNVLLKEYQLLGVNWLYLLYRRKLSCILADEMGLGKTIQVISFFAHLKEKGNKGPHLVVVPSSTLENWCREFARFAPSISVQTYYAGKEERPTLRQTLVDTQRCTSKTDHGWEVLITTYALAQGDDRDRKFFRKIEWDTCVFDEGHVLKNFQSQRYQALVRFGSKWRLLLTGTPLQNNLQELVSLMNFILPHRFAGALDSLRAIFKVKGDSKVTMLSQERVSRAKKMMTPFVLRRRKDQVLKDLPKKTERIEWCEMTPRQKSIYDDALLRSRKTIFDAAEDPAKTEDSPSTSARGKQLKKKTRATTRTKDKMYLENSSNVLMDLRKAASHPMLFRTRFTDQVLSKFAHQLLKEPEFKKRGALYELVKEDMEVMTDAELQLFAGTYKSTCKYRQDDSCYLEAGKVTVLLTLLSRYQKEGRKVLVFSQFTQILDILKAVLQQKDIKYLLLTGSTAVDVRQSLVDEFTEDESISVFLLSTKAGGMGINLTASSVVILFDQDFNPHNDRQAQDRAYRIGQKRDVEVIKLISRGTIEEDMLKLGETKLLLDEAVAGDNEDEKGESAPEREMKKSLMSVLRKQFEATQVNGETNEETETKKIP